MENSRITLFTFSIEVGILKVNLICETSIENLRNDPDHDLGTKQKQPKVR